MFEKFLSQNAGDFRQRYEGTFGFYRGEDKKRMLARLDSIGETVCTFTDQRGVEFHLNADAEKDIGFEFIPPKSQFYNADNGDVYLVSRLAARQFQRGISSRNVAIFKMHHSEAYLNPCPVGFAYLDLIYNKSHAPKDAAARFVKGKPFAIAKQFAFAHGVVYLFENKVGTFDSVDYKHFKVKLDEPDLWRTEITDALTALSRTVEVS